MGKRGRPLGSPIRDNIVEVLFEMGSGYGYDIYRKYLKLCGKASMRSIYHHLEKGTSMGIFMVEAQRTEPGSYSWGSTSERVYYKLGPLAKPKGTYVGNKLKK